MVICSSGSTVIALIGQGVQLYVDQTEGLPLDKLYRHHLALQDEPCGGAEVVRGAHLNVEVIIIYLIILLNIKH